MKNKKKGYTETFMVKIRKEKSEISDFKKIPFPKNLSVKRRRCLRETVSCLVSSSRDALYPWKLMQYLQWIETVKTVLLSKPKYPLASLLIKIIQE